MKITDKVIAGVIAHAIADYPNEACGIITAKSRYVRMTNTAAVPEKDFRISPEELLKHDVGAIVHSHPDGPDFPSESDIAGQINTAVPWGICVVDSLGAASVPYFWGSFEYTPPLIGRQFRHGPSGSDGRGDCYALIRDWYQSERGITLPDFARADGWWTVDKGDKDLYVDHFDEAGFVEIRADEVKDGDVFMGRVLSEKINHAGIYIGGGMILHHLSGRESRREPLGRWIKLVDKWVRYNA